MRTLNLQEMEVIEGGKFWGAECDPVPIDSGIIHDGVVQPIQEIAFIVVIIMFLVLIHIHKMVLVHMLATAFITNNSQFYILERCF